MHRVRRSWLPFMAAALVALVLLPSFAQPADAATSRWVAKCDQTRLRNMPWLSSDVRHVSKAGAVVTVTGVVTGGRWTAKCNNKTYSSRTWLRIVAINGKSVQSLYGRTALYGAYGLFKSAPLPAPTPTPTPTPPPTTDHVSNCSVRLRGTPSVDADTTAIIDDNSVVTRAETVTGSSWAADCGTSVAGDTWYRITAVGGQSVSSLYGVSSVYAASGLFRDLTPSVFVEGIDVSNWQGTISWGMVKAAGKKFAIAKATEGVGFKDASYDRNKAGAMGQGLAFGAYHFAQPVNDPVKEADWFVNNSDYQRGMLIPTLDLERDGGRSIDGLQWWVKAWLGRVNERLGVKPMIYASPSFWRNEMGNTRWFADNGYSILWVAHWQTTSPSVPGDNWGGKSWTFWQYTSDGSVPGIQGRVDLNRYRFQTFAAVTY